MHDTLIKEWTMDEPHDALRERTPTLHTTVDSACCLLIHCWCDAATGRTEGSRGIGPKAWRWVGEMEEIASAFSVRRSAAFKNFATFRERACVPSATCTLKLMVLLSIAQALELSGDFHTGAAKVYDGLAHLKGTPPTKSAAEMAQELATKASQKLEVKQALRGPVDLDF